MKFDDREYFDYSDVLIKPKPTSIKSRFDVNLYNSFKKMDATVVPIIIANMDHTGTIEMASAVEKHGLTVALHKFYTLEELTTAHEKELINRHHFISIGQSEADLAKFKKLHTSFPLVNNLMIDVANGYTSAFFEFLTQVRRELPNVFIAAGNVATPEILTAYKNAGVDAVKVGIGPGGQCRTRETAGVGIPQLTAVIDCVSEADNLGLLIIADGGINEYCDFAKALGAGADFVMSGSFFGGHKECTGGFYSINGELTMKMHGMSSKEAQLEHYGKLKDYRASEGRVSHILYKGEVKDTVQEILGCLRSTMTYTNTKNIIDLSNNVEFIKVKQTINTKYEKFTVGT